ncbi:Dolichyl-phosphate-mannose-protein mannosyltransferase-domain-containing protein [Mycena metata]|uniref:Dolichyl-phosphate-mannose-protein mannosyltransferase-domain-containing protein n=1 Tax=Mycena metata TaxID=1033252 RepID=A0AAD7H7P2_9AGAR|nr:Dolichyl-phosphate-mannose-protein mannosyltransferase-domain-containing protein [Mycena metata]
MQMSVDSQRAAASKGLNISSSEWKLLVSLRCPFVLSLQTRERCVHFGKFASKYIETQYFVDVHPSLAKLLITLAAFIFGHDGNFELKDIESKWSSYYSMGVDYGAVGLEDGGTGQNGPELSDTVSRFTSTIVLKWFFWTRLYDDSHFRGIDWCGVTTALLAPLFIAFLHSPLIFFTALSIFFWVEFCSEDKEGASTESWWALLLMSSLSLGAVASCKWLRFFTVATIALSTIAQLWALLGDLRISPHVFMRNSVARVLCLIVAPIIFYMGMFHFHFMSFDDSGDGDRLSSEFQHTSGGRGMFDIFTDAALGSEIAILYVNTQSRYLQSRMHNYPGASKCGEQAC